MKTNVYVDAFNLYYGCLKQTRHRWLDLAALSAGLLPQHQINRIRYFTALVSTIPGDGDGNQPQRQQMYLRALRTIPNLTIHEGHYLSGTRKMRLANPPQNGPKFVDVVKMEEKGSDVNLATMLLVDAFRNDFEQALLITNDSDLAMPVELVGKEIGKPVGIAYPCTNPGRRPSSKLRSVAAFTRDIRVAALAKSQFPPTLTDPHGTITKPAKW